MSIGQADLLDPVTAVARVSTNAIRDMLRKRYPDPEWALFEEVARRNGGGSGYADAVAMNTYPSRGHAVHGFEIKVSRGDWLKELKQPLKAEAIFDFCDYWWLVAAKGIVRAGELPMGWGLIEATPATLKATQAATKLKPKPIDRELFASLFRRSYAALEQRAADMVRQERIDAREQNLEAIEREVQHRTSQFRHLQDSARKFEEATGLSFGGRWGSPPIETIKLAQRLERLSGYDREKMFGKLEAVAADLERTVKTIREVLTGDEKSQPGDAG